MHHAADPWRVGFTKGRINERGKLVTRGKARRLEHALFLYGRHLQSQAASSRRKKLRKQQVEGLGGEAE